jgi:hypothetical protein
VTRPYVNSGSFNPFAVVEATMALLDEAGLPSVLDVDNARAARKAATELLACFGVEPWRPLDRDITSG